MTGAKFEFIAELSASKSVMAKQWSPGELHLTLVVKQPAPPREPDIPYQYSQRQGNTTVWKARPADLKRKPKETDGEYGRRNQKTAAEQKAWDVANARWRAAVVVYEREVAAIQKRTMDYATMVGISSILGAKPLQVTIQPVQSGMFDNFGLSLIGPGGLEGAAKEAAGYDPSDDYDDEDEDEPLDVTPAEPSRSEALAALADDDDPPCPGCGHPLASSHDDDGEFGGCSVVIKEPDELCPCPNGPDGTPAKVLTGASA